MENDDPQGNRRNYKHGFPKVMSINNVLNRWNSIIVHVPRTFFPNNTERRVINTQGIRFEIFYTPEHPENDTAISKALLKFQSPTTYNQIMILHNILKYFAHNNQQVLQQLDDLMARQMQRLAYLGIQRPNDLPLPPPPPTPSIDLTSETDQTSRPRTSTAMVHPYRRTGGRSSQSRITSMATPQRNRAVLTLGLCTHHHNHHMSTGYMSGTAPPAHQQRIDTLNLPYTITSNMAGQNRGFQPDQNTNQNQETQPRTIGNNILQHRLIPSSREQRSNFNPIPFWTCGRDLLNRPTMTPNMVNRIDPFHSAHNGSTSQRTHCHENILHPHPHHHFIPNTGYQICDSNQYQPTNCMQHGNAPQGTQRDSMEFQLFPPIPFHIRNDSVPTVNINHYPTSALPVDSNVGASFHRPQNLPPMFNAQLMPPFNQQAQVGMYLPVQPIQSQVTPISFPLAEQLSNVARDQNHNLTGLHSLPQIPSTNYNQRNIHSPNYNTSQYQGNHNNRMIYDTDSQSVNPRGNATNHGVLPSSNLENMLNRQFNSLDESNNQENVQPLINTNNAPRIAESPLVDELEAISDAISGFVPGSVQPNTTANNEPQGNESDFNTDQVETIEQNIQRSGLHQSNSGGLNIPLENPSDPARNINDQLHHSEITVKTEDKGIWVYEGSQMGTSNETAPAILPNNESSSSREATGNDGEDSPQFSLSSGNSEQLVIDEGVTPWEEDREGDPDAGNMTPHDHDYY